jgi:hypothetical protein
MRTVDAASVFARAAVMIASALLPASGPPRDVADGAADRAVDGAADDAVAGAVVGDAGGVDAGGVDVREGAVETGPLAALAVADLAETVGAALAPRLLAPEPHAVMTADEPQAASTITAVTLAARAGPPASRVKWFTMTPFRLPVGVWDAQEKRSRPRGGAGERGAQFVPRPHEFYRCELSIHHKMLPIGSRP